MFTNFPNFPGIIPGLRDVIRRYLYGNVSSLELMHDPPAWIAVWEQIGDANYRRDNLTTLKRLLKLENEVSDVFNGKDRFLHRETALGYLERAGESLSTQQGSGVATALADSVEQTLVEQRSVDNAMMALGVLIAGILVQGAFIGGLSLIVFHFRGESWKDEVFGVKSLTLVAVVISGIIGSLARAIHEARTGRDTPANIRELIINAVARPLLAAILVLFVFVLFEGKLLGVPFEDDATDMKKFVREDFFFIGIAFAIGFNDTLGLNALGVISRTLPGRRGASQGGQPQEDT